MLPQTFTPQFLKNLELFKLQSRRAYLGARQGGHSSLKRGHGIEFSDFRKYEMGDSPRWIDWNVYARTDKLYVRRYQEEENLSVLVLLDTSSSMRTPTADGKWERARDIAIALSYVALMEQDSVTVAPLGYPISPTYHGGRAIHQLGADLQKLQFSDAEHDLVIEAQRAVARVRFPGIALFVSDFLMPFVEIRKIFNVMLAKNLDVTAVQVLGPNDLNPLAESSDAIAVDSETGEEIDLSLDSDSRGRYEYLLNSHNHQIREFIGSRRIRYACAHTTEDLSKFVLNTLSSTGLLT